MKYKPTVKLRIIPALIQSHKHSLMGLYTRGDFYTEPVLRLEFFKPAICISRKRNGNKTKKKTMLLRQNTILLLNNKQNT